MEAGQRSCMVTFLRAVTGSADAYRNTRKELQPIDGAESRSAKFRPQFGREQLDAGRLEATLTGTLTVVASVLMQSIKPSDTVRFETAPWSPRICQIRSIVPTPDRRDIEMLLEEGVAL